MLGTMPIAADWKRLLLEQARSVDIAPVAEASSNLLVVPRVDKTQAGAPAARIEASVVVELENRPGTIGLPQSATDLLTGKKHSGSVEMSPYGVMVLAY
ncbi:MAG TPA: Beta-galactosidase C-terminal domain [Phycisphaerae bacterium]|nr:Beta-galactosidase C-terminal domain [Phycisphaerae bacterium]